MTMRARLDRWGSGDIKLPAPLDPASKGIIFHLVLERPASGVGKRVELHLDGDEVLDMLQWMRAEAIRQRTVTEREAMQQR